MTQFNCKTQYLMRLAEGTWDRSAAISTSCNMYIYMENLGMDSVRCCCSLAILLPQPRLEGEMRPLCSCFTLSSLAARSFMAIGPVQIRHEGISGPRQVENSWPLSSGCSGSCNPSREMLLLPQAAAFPACVRDSLCLPLPFTTAGQNNFLVS